MRASAVLRLHRGHDCTNSKKGVISMQAQKKIMKTDPVCNMQVDASQSQDKASFKGQTYYFCSDKCRKDFMKSPDQFLQQKKAG